MDGLSLLALACQQEIQEEDTFIDVERLEQGGKDEIRNIDSMKETEHCERMFETKSSTEAKELEVNTPSIKNEACEDDVIYIGEIKEEEEKFIERSLRTLEKSSRATSRHLSVENRGNFSFKIFVNQFCKYSTFTGWHLQRSRGMMKINVKFQNLNMFYGPLIVRALLVRKESSYRHFGVDIVCEKHKRDVGLMSINHVLHPAPGMEFASYFDSTGERNSLCFEIGKPKPDGSLEASIALKSMCNDTCFTCADPSFKQTENSRDLLLVLTLESPDRWEGCNILPKSHIADVGLFFSKLYSLNTYWKNIDPDPRL